MSFGQFCPVGPVYQRNMGVNGRRPAKGIENMCLSERVREVIVAADVVDSWRLIPFERHWHSPVLGIALLREDAAVPPGGGSQVVQRGL